MGWPWQFESTAQHDKTTAPLASTEGNTRVTGFRAWLMARMHSRSVRAVAADLEPNNPEHWNEGSPRVRMK